MACGDRFRHLAITTSGHTLDEPGLIFPGSPTGGQIYAEWHDLARKLSLQANQMLNELGAIEERVAPSYPVWNALVPLNNQIVDKYDDLSQPGLVLFSNSSARDEAMSVVQDALCLIDQVDNALATYKKPPDSPKVIEEADTSIPMWVWATGGTVVLGGLTAATVALVRHRKRRKLEQLAA